MFAIQPNAALAELGRVGRGKLFLRFHSGHPPRVLPSRKPGAVQGIAPTYFQPGKPQQNAYVERHNRTVQQEWLDLYIFETIEEVQQIATEWLWTHNNDRPNMGICGVTPAQKQKMAA